MIVRHFPGLMLTEFESAMGGMSKFNIFIVDDHPTFRAGLRAILDAGSNFVVVGEAASPEAARAKIRMSRVDLLTLDITMAKGDAMASIRDFKKDKPDLRILMLTMHRDWDFVHESALAGADGYLLKDREPEAIRSAVLDILSGKKLFPEGVIAASVGQDHSNLDALSKREIEVLRLVGRGLPSREIAVGLGLSVRTVESHRASMVHKLGLKGGMDLVRVAASFLAHEKK